MATGVIRPRVNGKARAAARLNRERGFKEQDATLGMGEYYPPALGTLHDLFVVECRIKPTQAETKTALAVLPAVAGSLIATGARKRRNDFADEIHRAICVGVRYFNRDRRRLTADGHGDCRPSIADRVDHALFINRSD